MGQFGDHHPANARRSDLERQGAVHFERARDAVE